jgi:hypothetical protein
MLALTVLGVNDVTMVEPMEILAAFMFIPMLSMVFGGIAHDITKQMNTDQPPVSV